MKKFHILALCALIFTACSSSVKDKEHEIRRWNMGPIRSALVAPSGTHYSNDLPPMQIRTSKIVLTVTGVKEKDIPQGVDLIIVDMSNHQRYALMGNVKAYVSQWFDYEKDPFKDDENREAN